MLGWWLPWDATKGSEPLVPASASEKIKHEFIIIVIIVIISLLQCFNSHRLLTELGAKFLRDFWGVSKLLRLPKKEKERGLWLVWDVAMDGVTAVCAGQSRDTGTPSLILI